MCRFLVLSPKVCLGNKAGLCYSLEERWKGPSWLLLSFVLHLFSSTTRRRNTTYWKQYLKVTNCCPLTVSNTEHISIWNTHYSFCFSMRTILGLSPTSYRSSLSIWGI